MAPSEIPKEVAAAAAAGTSGSRYLSSSSASPSSAPSPNSSSKNVTEQERGADDGGGVGTVDKDTAMADSPMDSEEEIYRDDDDHSADHNDNSHEDNRKHGDSSEILGAQQQQYHQRRTRIRSSARYSNDNNYNGSAIKTVPEVKYAKAHVLMDRGNGAGAGIVSSQILPGETLYLAQNPGPRATGQYQMHPGYSNNNGVNGNYNNGNNNGGYGPNGISSPQPHPYNGNGAHQPPNPHYPFLHYPQVQPGAPPYYYDPHGQYVTSNTTSGTGLNVRGEEIGIVLVVLLLWVGAIILFFNRWGKIRMLEPYQPKFIHGSTLDHRPSCPLAEVTAISNIPCRERAFSKFNLSTEMLASPHFVKCNYHGVPSADPAPGFSGLGTTLPGGLTIPGTGFPAGGSTGMLNNHRNSIMMNHHPQHHHHHHLRPRQNSVFVTSPSSQVSFYGSDTALKSSSRKTKSAVDLPTLVLTGEFIDNVRRNSKNNSITQL